ncbi:MAG: glycoside hydrolase family 99-like domain-containing protein [Microcoleus sp.]
MTSLFQGNSETVSTYFNRANLLKQSGNWEEAAAVYYLCIEINPNFSWYYHNLGEVLAKMGNWEEAEGCYRRACELSPNSAWSWHNLGEVLQQQGNLEAAVASYRRAVETDPDFYEFYNSLGKCLGLQGELNEAVVCLRKAIELEPESALPYQNLWEPLARLGQVDEGIDCLQKAIALNPGDCELYQQLAEALYGKNHWEDAAIAYRKSIKLNPNYYWSYYKLGTIFVAQGKLEEAIASYKKASELEPDSASVIHHLGHALASVQRWEEAIACYRKALKLVPNSAMIYQHLGDSLGNLQKWEQAVEAYHKSVEFEPNSLEAQDRLGFALYQLGRYDEAISSYRKALEIAPDSDVAHTHLGDAMLALQAWDEAIALYQRAIELSPQTSETYQHLGEALTQKQQWREAAASYQQALQFHPAANDLYRELGEFLIQQNQYEGAVGFFLMSLQPEPKSPDYPWLALSKVIEAYKRTKYSWSKSGTAQITVQEKVSIQNILSSELNQNSNSKTSDVRLIAYYLPQFHTIPENDLWWGKGFTEWTNVTKAQPLFEGHYQPHLPADLGFYDLRLPEVREAQAQLAKKYGIYGFCYYYYWFAGKRLLHLPIDEVISSKKPDFPFCICWANENWTRRWDGADHEVLMAQEHSLESNQAFAESIIHILLDDRYIRINGAPLLIIYRSDILTNPLRTTEEWRKIFRQRGVGEVHLSLAATFNSSFVDPKTLGFDSAVQFPPHAITAIEVPAPGTGVPNLSAKFYDYRDTVLRNTANNLPSHKLFPAVMTSWDNTARRKTAAHAFIDSHPDAYEIWLRGSIEKVKQRYSGDERLVFINAWNEWAEGAHLEPDQKYGHGYLSATYKALHGTHSWRTSLELLRHLPGKSIESIHQLLDELEMKMSGKNRSLQALCQILQELVVVSEVTYCHNESDLWWNLESPSQDTLNDTALTIKGWVLPKTSPAVAVEVLLHGTSIVQIPVDMERQDVAQVHSWPGAERCGFLTALEFEAVKLPSKVDLNIRAVLKNGSYVPLAELHLESGLESLKKQEQFDEINGSLEPLQDAVQTIINLLRLFDEKNINIHQKLLLDQLQKKIEAKEQLIENITHFLKQIPQHNL